MGRRETKCTDCEGSGQSARSCGLPVDPSDGEAAIGADIGDGRILAAEGELT